MESKICNKCKIVHPISEYYKNGKESWCKPCSRIQKKIWANKNKLQKREYDKKRRQENSLKIRKAKSEFYFKNKEKIQVKSKIFRQKNKEKIALSRSIYAKNNKEKLIQDRKKFYQKNKDKINESNKIYVLKNIEKVKERRRVYRNKNKGNEDRKRRKQDWQNNRYKTCEMFRLKSNLRRVISHSLKRGGYKKDGKTEHILGASFEIVKQHIEKQFTKGMMWSKVGEFIHIDHKIPLASAKTKEDLFTLFHYTNLQPLWAKDNLEKATKIFPIQTTLTI